MYDVPGVIKNSVIVLLNFKSSAVLSQTKSLAPIKESFCMAKRRKHTVLIIAKFTLMPLLRP
jgi:hypothetical protein